MEEGREGEREGAKAANVCAESGVRIRHAPPASFPPSPEAIDVALSREGDIGREGGREGGTKRG